MSGTDWKVTTSLSTLVVKGDDDRVVLTLGENSYIRSVHVSTH